MGQKQLLLKVQQNSDENSGAALICKNVSNHLLNALRLVLSFMFEESFVYFIYICMYRKAQGIFT